MKLFNRKLIILYICYITLFFPIFLLAEELESKDLVVLLKVNHQDTNMIGRIFITHLNNIMIKEEDLKFLEIEKNYIETGQEILNGIAYINLDLLNETSYNLDIDNLILEITFPSQYMRLQKLNIDPKREDEIENAVSSSVYGGFFNYDLTFFNTSKNNQVSGLQELNYFSPAGILQNSFIFKSHQYDHKFKKIKTTEARHDPLIRLDTNWTFDDTKNVARFRIGDSITRAADWSSSTRFLGLQYATDFSIRPNLITYPLVHYKGRSDIPTTFEIYANNEGVYHGETKRGDFDIANIPVTTGRGDLMVKVKDITGKIQTLVIPYYVSPLLLKEGLSNFSIEGGVKRQHYGIKSNSYSNLLINGDYLYGLNDYWTCGAHFEMYKSLASIGVTNNIKLSNYGIISSSIASNVSNLENSQKISFSYNYQSDIISTNFIVNKSFKNYKNVYIAPLKDSSSHLSYQISVGHSNKVGNFFINFFSSVPYYNHDRTNLRLNSYSVSYDRNILKHGFFRISAGSNLKAKNKNAFINMSFGLNLDKYSVSINSYKNKTSKTHELSVASILTEPFGYRYRANIVKGSKYNYELEAIRLSPGINAGLHIYEYDKHRSATFNTNGSLVAMEKHLFATQPINRGLALAKVDKMKGIPVYYNHLIAGYSNAEGLVLVPNIQPYMATEVTVDATSVPLNTNFESLTLYAAPKNKTGVVLDFKMQPAKTLGITLVDEYNTVLEPGLKVMVKGIEEELHLGYEGKLYINDVKDLDLIEGVIDLGKRTCTFSIAAGKTNSTDIILYLGKAVCK